MKKYFLILAMLLSTSNLFSQDFAKVKGGNCFSIDIPKYMTKSYDLNDVASLQYQNSIKEAYVIIIDDDKEHLESLGVKFVNSKEFLESTVSNFYSEAQDRKIGSINEFVSNGLGHSQVEITLRADDTDLYYLITAVETNEHFYKIICWTLLENKDKLKNDYKTISKSLKE